MQKKYRIIIGAFVFALCLYLIYKVHVIGELLLCLNKWYHNPFAVFFADIPSFCRDLVSFPFGR